MYSGNGNVLFKIEDYYGIYSIRMSYYQDNPVLMYSITRIVSSETLEVSIIRNRLSHRELQKIVVEFSIQFCKLF